MTAITPSAHASTRCAARPAQSAPPPATLPADINTDRLFHDCAQRPDNLPAIARAHNLTLATLLAWIHDPAADDLITRLREAIARRAEIQRDLAASAFDPDLARLARAPFDSTCHSSAHLRALELALKAASLILYPRSLPSLASSPPARCANFLHRLRSTFRGRCAGPSASQPLDTRQRRHSRLPRPAPNRQQERTVPSATPVSGASERSKPPIQPARWRSPCAPRPAQPGADRATLTQRHALWSPRANSLTATTPPGHSPMTLRQSSPAARPRPP